MQVQTHISIGTAQQCSLLSCPQIKEVCLCTGIDWLSSSVSQRMACLLLKEVCLYARIDWLSSSVCQRMAVGQLMLHIAVCPLN